MSEHLIDKQGDVWVEGDDGLMHTPETRPFPRDYVERKWGPLRPVALAPHPTTTERPAAEAVGESE